MTLACEDSRNLSFSYQLLLTFEQNKSHAVDVETKPMIGQDFEVLVQLRFWGWSLVEILKLKILWLEFNWQKFYLMFKTKGFEQYKKTAELVKWGIPYSQSPVNSYHLWNCSSEDRQPHFLQRRSMLYLLVNYINCDWDSIILAITCVTQNTIIHE